MSTMHAGVENMKSTLHPSNLQTHMASVQDYAGSSVQSHSSTIETLHHAVTKMNPGHVEHMIHAGVNVNQPIDRQGHTVLDAFAVEHQNMLKKLINLKASPEEKTQIFYTNQENARKVLEILTNAGAKMSSPETSRQRVSYVA